MNPHENETPYVKDQQSKSFYNKYFKNADGEVEERANSEEYYKKRQNE